MKKTILLFIILGIGLNSYSQQCYKEKHKTTAGRIALTTLNILILVTPIYFGIKYYNKNK